MGKHEHASDHHQSTNTPEQSSSTNSGRPYAPETGGQQGHSPSDHHHQQQSAQEQRVQWPSSNGRPVARTESNGQQSRSSSDNQQLQQSAQDQRVQWPSSNGRPVARTEGNGQQGRPSSDNRQQQPAQEQSAQVPSSNGRPVASGANSSSATEHRNEATPQTGQGPINRWTLNGDASRDEPNQTDSASGNLRLESRQHVGPGVEASTHMQASVNLDGNRGTRSSQVTPGGEVGGGVTWTGGANTLSAEVNGNIGPGGLSAGMHASWERRIGDTTVGVGTNVNAGPGGSSVEGHASWERNGFKLSATGTANSEGSQNVEVTASFGEDKSHEPPLTNDQGLAHANNAVTNVIENSRWTPQAREAFLRAVEFHPFPPQDPLLPSVEGPHHTQEQQNRTRDH